MTGIAKNEWADADLEWLNQCPACKSNVRDVLFEGLRDWSYGIAPGEWILWRCASCKSAYLDPRPNQLAIGRAYRNYYTHENDSASDVTIHLKGGTIRSRLRLGYYNSKFGHKFDEGLAIGKIAALIQPKRARLWDDYLRHLPPPSSRQSRLLDVGCGSGNFLQIASALGYNSLGIDPDDCAVEAACFVGQRAVKGEMPNSGLPPAQFDQVTVNHVFEHLHEPQESAQELLRVMRPGARIWFSQPNLDAEGRFTFGKYWRGLESPRHLSLFSEPSFVELLQKAGFERIKRMGPRLDAESYFMSSVAMMNGCIPQNGLVPHGWSLSWAAKSRAADRSALRNPGRAESFTIVAFKPS